MSKIGFMNGGIAAVLLLTSAVFAANKAGVEIRTPVSVAAMQLAPGNYSVAWNGSGNMELKIFRDGVLVATTHARVVNLDHPSPYTAIVRQKNSDGADSLSQILLSGKSYALQIDNGATPSGSAGAQ